MKITVDINNVINMLKAMVNSQCANGFQWYPEAPAKVEASLFDINIAIKVLEEAKERVNGEIIVEK